jgi:hypothetical protein
MTLANMLLEKLSEWRPPGGRASLSVTDPASGWSAHLTADQRDVVGCLLWELSVRRPSSPAGEALRDWAERIASRTAALAEPIKVLEVDASRNEALLRSDGPAPRGDTVLYFEILVRGTTEAILRRYQASHLAGQKREQVVFALTYEGLASLVRGLTE